MLPGSYLVIIDRWESLVMFVSRFREEEDEWADAVPMDSDDDPPQHANGERLVGREPPASHPRIPDSSAFVLDGNRVPGELLHGLWTPRRKHFDRLGDLCASG
jgi:hypothetical protein